MTNDKKQSLADTYERVYTVMDFFDQPRSGIANVAGRPHHYQSVFEDASDTSTHLRLRAIDDATLQLALEGWDIWLRWLEAHKAGTAPVDSHPALPRDRERLRQIEALLNERLAAAAEPVRAIGRFRRTETMPSGWEVRWDRAAAELVQGEP